MSFDYGPATETAHAALLEYGTTAVIMRKSAPGGDSFNPSAGATTDYDCNILYTKWRGNLIDGTMIRATDQKILVSAVGLSIVPQIGDRFWDGVSMNGAERVTGAIVEPSDRIAPSAVPVLFTINVRF